MLASLGNVSVRTEDCFVPLTHAAAAPLALPPSSPFPRALAAAPRYHASSYDAPTARSVGLARA
jgi:hypothetical protein